MSSTRRWLRKRMGRYGRELPESLVKAIEDIDIHQSPDSPYPTVGRQLPNGKVYIGLVLTISRYPHLIVLPQIVTIGIVSRQMLIDKRLADIQYRPHTKSTLYILQP